MLVNRKNNRPNPIARQARPNNYNHKRSTNRFGPLAKNGNMEEAPERAKHKGHTGPRMVNIHRTASTSESGNPNIAQEIFSKGQKDERQLNKDKDPAIEGQTLPEIPASSYNPSLGQATNNNLELMNIEDSSPNPPSSPFNPTPAQISCLTPPPSTSVAPQNPIGSFDLKQKPPDINHEYLQQHQLQRRPGDTISATHQDETQFCGVIPQTRERNHSPSRHRMVDRRDKTEYRAQVGERGRTTPASNSDDSPKAIRVIQEDSA
ncbi:hypothetical protein LOK49_LG02G02780 [Camellia lanceoleosa]|uniref:Uncharacterized protein n=1 Tax=Camellia lanceoleosa TaxID=1840588 RepID=A0ACC0IKJ0_9ERIC|nr:hypothetical protein LOK49_LG02G02780 [Camellia lanceoleosa]